MDGKVFDNGMNTAVLLKSTPMKDEVIHSSEDVECRSSSAMCSSNCIEYVNCGQIEECPRKLENGEVVLQEEKLNEESCTCSSIGRNNDPLSLTLENALEGEEMIGEKTNIQRCCSFPLNEKPVVETVDRLSKKKENKLLKPLVKECKKKRKSFKSTKKSFKRHECTSNNIVMQIGENEIGRILEDWEDSEDSAICTNKEKDTLLHSHTNESKKKRSSVKKTKHKSYEKPSDQIVKMYQCTQCPKVFQRVSNFNAHQRKHTAVKTKPFSCQDCMSTFSYRFQLTQHVRIHTGERPFQCHTCKKTFARKGCLVAHMITHTDSLPYQCDLCNRRFARKYNLSKHIESHSSERPHCCLECSRRFKCKQSLEKHLRIHQLSIYACTICHQSFDTKRRLTNHTLNEHVSYRPFTCQICNKPFIFKSQLTYHIKEHELERPYSCAKCKKSYFKKGHLLSHIKQYCSSDTSDTEASTEVVL